MHTMSHTQQQRIGINRGARRVCLWNRAMVECGFTIGQPIQIVSDAHSVSIFPAIQPTRKKVSRSLNHGNVLAVIDLKETKSLDMSHLGNVGDSVTVTFEPGIITVTRSN
jgi:hypothetical protein